MFKVKQVISFHVSFVEDMAGYVEIKQDSPSLLSYI